METTCQFSIGQIIHHLKFDYRGVIIDVHASFESSEEWYEMMAKSNPPKDKPWYQVLLNKTTTTKYLQDQNLE